MSAVTRSGDTLHVRPVGGEPIYLTVHEATVGSYDRPDLWLRRALINRTISHWRKAKSEATALSLVGDNAPVASGEELVDRLGVWHEVANLPRRQRQAIALVYGCDLSLDDAAQVMRCSTGSVKTHLSRARSTLEATVKEYQ